MGKAIKAEVNGTTLEQADQFKYLGTQITVNEKVKQKSKAELI